MNPLRLVAMDVTAHLDTKNFSTANRQNPFQRVKEGVSRLLNPLWVSAISLGIHSEVG
jgi:hypothetical protein